MIVDAHVHLWNDPSRGYAWLEAPERAVIRRPVLPAELLVKQRESGVERAVLVEGGAGQTFEIEDLLAMARASPAIGAVVGFVDLEWTDLGTRLRHYLQLPGGEFLTGARAHISRKSDVGYLDAPVVARALDTIADADFVFDVVARPEQLDHVMHTVRAHQNLRVVLTHMAAPDFTLRGLPEWRRIVKRFAELEQVVAMKLSGFACDPDADPAMVRHYVSEAIEIMGVGRVMLGTDWPGSLVAGNDYRAAWEMALASLPQLSASELAGVAGTTAAAVYRVH